MDSVSKDLFEFMSALQKCIRRGLTEDAYYFASKIEDINPKTLWNRIRIISSEDVGPANPTLPVTIAVLEKWYWEEIKKEKSGGRLHLVNAIIQLCNSKKSRDADNLLIAMDCKMMAGILHKEVPDFALDKHTLRGKKMGRGFEHFFKEGTKCEDDNSNPLWKEQAPAALEAYGSPVKWKMDKLKRFSDSKKPMDDFF